MEISGTNFVINSGFASVNFETLNIFCLFVVLKKIIFVVKSKYFCFEVKQLKFVFNHSGLRLNKCFFY